MTNPAAYDLLWITVEPDEEIYLPNEPRKLTVICAEILVTDVLLVMKYCNRLPKPIHSLILSTAILKRRTLSIEHLMRFCPAETLELPVPDVLKPMRTVFKTQNGEIDYELSGFTRISIMMLSVFFDLIKKENSNSKLQILDLGLIPLCRVALTLTRDFLIETRAKICILERMYTLRCAVAVENAKDLHILNICAEVAASLGFKFDIAGIFYYNNYFPDVQAIKILDNIRVSNLQLIGFSFASLVPRFDSFLSALCCFKLIKYLNLSYLSDSLSSETNSRALAATLTELPNLQRLVLKGINLNNRLSFLFLEYCKKKSADDTVANCCLVHNGSLHYLDISSCKLSDSDLEFLSEMALAKSLKYLDVSGNSFHERRTCEILLSLKSNLRALNISDCFKQQADYDDVLFPFSSFVLLKYLNIKGLWENQRSVYALEHELQKLPNLEIVETSASLSLNVLTIN